MGAPSHRDAIQIVIHAGGQIRAELTFDKPRVTIGTQSSCDVVLEGEGVRRIHATLLRSPARRYTLIDDSGRGGTRLNGDPVSSAELHLGDELEIGQYTLTISAGVPDTVIASTDIVDESPAAPPRAESGPLPPLPQRKSQEIVLVPDSDGALLAAKVAPILWSATSDEMASEPRTGEVDMRTMPNLLNPDEPILLTQRKPKLGPRRIKERAPKKPR
jgi:type VI secretion system protein ImpI